MNGTAFFPIDHTRGYRQHLKNIFIKFNYSEHDFSLQTKFAM